MSAPGHLSMALADIDDVAAARRLADRLIVAKVGATVSAASGGFRVWVRRSDYEDAKVMASLFAEIDANVSRVAPAPESVWQRGGLARLAGSAIVAVLFAVLLILLWIAALR